MDVQAQFPNQSVQCNFEGILPSTSWVSHFLKDEDEIHAHLEESNKFVQEVQVARPVLDGPALGRRSQSVQQQPVQPQPVALGPRRRGRPKKAVQEEEEELPDMDQIIIEQQVNKIKFGEGDQDLKVDWILGSLASKKVKKEEDNAEDNSRSFHSNIEIKHEFQKKDDNHTTITKEKTQVRVREKRNKPFKPLNIMEREDIDIGSEEEKPYIHNDKKAPEPKKKQEHMDVEEEEILTSKPKENRVELGSESSEQEKSSSEKEKNGYLTVKENDFSANVSDLDREIETKTVSKPIIDKKRREPANTQKVPISKEGKGFKIFGVKNTAPATIVTATQIKKNNAETANKPQQQQHLPAENNEDLADMVFETASQSEEEEPEEEMKQYLDQNSRQSTTNKKTQKTASPVVVAVKGKVSNQDEDDSDQEDDSDEDDEEEGQEEQDDDDDDDDSEDEEEEEDDQEEDDQNGDQEEQDDDEEEGSDEVEERDGSEDMEEEDSPEVDSPKHITAKKSAEKPQSARAKINEVQEEDDDDSNSESEEVTDIWKILNKDSTEKKSKKAKTAPKKRSKSSFETESESSESEIDWIDKRTAQRKPIKKQTTEFSDTSSYTKGDAVSASESG